MHYGDILVIKQLSMSRKPVYIRKRFIEWYYFLRQSFWKQEERVNSRRHVTASSANVCEMWEGHYFLVGLLRNRTTFTCALSLATIFIFSMVWYVPFMETGKRARGSYIHCGNWQEINSMFSYLHNCCNNESLLITVQNLYNI